MYLLIFNKYMSCGVSEVKCCHLLLNVYLQDIANPLHVAALKGQVALVKYFIEEQGIEPSVVDQVGYVYTLL